MSVTYDEVRAACVERWGDGRELTTDARFVEWRTSWTWPRRMYLCVDGEHVYLLAAGVANAPAWTLAGADGVTPLGAAIADADTWLRDANTIAHDAAVKGGA